MNKARVQVEEYRTGGDITIEEFVSMVRDCNMNVYACFEYGDQMVGFSSSLRICNAAIEMGQGYFVNIHSDVTDLVIARKCKRVFPFKQGGESAFFLDFDDVFVTIKKSKNIFSENY